MPISEQHFHMIWHEKNNDDPGHRWLRETLMRQLQPDGPGSEPTETSSREATPRA